MLYLGDTGMQMNRMDQSRPLLESVVKAEPANGMAHRDLGIVLAEQGRNDEALKEFHAAIGINPKDVNAHYRLARLYRAMGKTSEAKVEFEKASGLNKAEDERLLKVMSTVPSNGAKSGSVPNQ
jgi:Tfp pilus assembly protein PilF